MRLNGKILSSVSLQHKFPRLELICCCQERCSHLVSDVAKLQRAAAAARRGQLASVKAMHSANAAKAEVTTRALLPLFAQSFGFAASDSPIIRVE